MSVMQSTPTFGRITLPFNQSIMTKKQKTFIVLGVPLIAVALLATYFNRDTIHVTNIPPKVAEEVGVPVTLTPEQMIEKVLNQVQEDSVGHMENVNAFNEYVDYVHEQMTIMQKETDRLADIASTSGAKLDQSTRAYSTLREQLGF